jgi:hypothetical protein
LPRTNTLAYSSRASATGERIFFRRSTQERFTQLLQQNQSPAFPLASTVKRAPATDDRESACTSSGGGSSINGGGAATTTTTTASTSSSSGSSSLTARPQYRHRALSRDGARDIFEPVRESNPAPSAAEVVASLLSDRGYGSRIPLKQRLVANQIVARAAANNLNNNKTVLKKDLVSAFIKLFCRHLKGPHDIQHNDSQNSNK